MINIFDEACDSDQPPASKNVYQITPSGVTSWATYLLPIGKCLPTTAPHETMRRSLNVISVKGAVLAYDTPDKLDSTDEQATRR